MKDLQSQHVCVPLTGVGERGRAGQDLGAAKDESRVHVDG